MPALPNPFRDPRDCRFRVRLAKKKQADMVALGPPSLDPTQVAESGKSRLKGETIPPLRTQSAISSSIRRPALNAAASGANGESPAATRSALMNRKHFASSGRKESAKVVFPAPFGPAMMMIFFPMIQLH